MENNIQNIDTKDTLKEVGLSVFRQLETQYAQLENIANANKGLIHRFIKTNNIDFAIVVELSHLMVTTGVNEGQSFTELSSAIGNRILNFYNINLPKDDFMPIKFGAFVLNAYAVLDLILIKLVKKSYGTALKSVYYTYAGHRGKLKKLKKEFDETSDPYKPLFQQPADWEYGTTQNTLGEPLKLIKHGTVDTLSKINPNNTPIVLNAVNKKQKVAYTVRPEIFEIYKWALETDQACFEHNSVETIELDRKIAKKAEATAIADAAEPYVGKIFFQQYQADYRGRLYPLSAYLNEVNSDNAKGMLSYSIGMPLGPTGLNQLKHHISNMFGEDKLTHEGRVKVVDDNYSAFVSYGLFPKENIGWMDADEPFQFLNACMELARLDKFTRAGGNPEEFESHTICYRDGSTNGLQWLLALAKDDVNASLVNLRKSPDGKPGDMYTHIAKAVIVKIAEKVGEEKAIAFENYDVFYKAIEKLRNRMRTAENKYGPKHPISERKRKVVKWYQKRYKDELKSTDLIYWGKAKDNGFDRKTWRKILKRNIMTYGYSSTRSGMGQQIIDDTKDIDNQYLSNKQHSAARLLGQMVYDSIEGELPIVSALMKLFRNNCSKYMIKTKNQYKHNTVISNFPFVQSYYKKKVKVIDLRNVYITGADYKTKEYTDIQIKAHFDTNTPDVKKAKAGISPNSIHNLDSLHLMLVINACDFDIVSAHDSYGSHACNVVEMQKVIREQFKRVLDSGPIESILEQTGHLETMIDTGELDSSEILESEFAFS